MGEAVETAVSKARIGSLFEPADSDISLWLKITVSLNICTRVLIWLWSAVSDYNHEASSTSSNIKSNGVNACRSDWRYIL